MRQRCVRSTRTTEVIYAYWDHQWLKYGVTRGNAVPHLHILVQSVPPPQISKRRKGTLRGTLGYADLTPAAFLPTV